MTNKTVHYRKGQFFVLEERLTDGSHVYDVCANSAAGDELITLQHAESENSALAACNALAAVFADGLL